MKRFKVALSILLILIMSIASPAFAAPKDKPVKQGIVYTALGDSIAFGTGATGQYGYTDMFNDHLTRTRGAGQYFELSKDGVTSTLLLESLDNLQVQAAVAAADVITISIGGNDLLGLFLIGFGQLIKDNYSIQYPPFVNIDKLMMDLADWQADPFNLDYLHFNQLLIGLDDQFTTAVDGFEDNWPAIIEEVRAINKTSDKNADIYVNTVYNPFINVPILHKAVDEHIQRLNAAIEENAEDNNYKVVDVYQAFEDYYNPQKPELGDLSNLAQFVQPIIVSGQVVSYKFDSDTDVVPVPLHPTNRGYKIIFNMLKGSMP